MDTDDHVHTGYTINGVQRSDQDKERRSWRQKASYASDVIIDLFVSCTSFPRSSSFSWLGRSGRGWPDRVNFLVWSLPPYQNFLISVNTTSLTAGSRVTLRYVPLLASRLGLFCPSSDLRNLSRRQAMLISCEQTFVSLSVFTQVGRIRKVGRA